MQHPAITNAHRNVGLALAFFGVVVILLSAGPPPGEPSNIDAAGLSLGIFLMALSLIYFAVHAVGMLLYEQELLRRRLKQATLDAQEAQGDASRPGGAEN